MGTRSRIAIEDNETGKVRSVYCHWDGYPEGVGKTLVAHYKEREAVEALIALGSLSSLNANIAPPKGQPHSFDGPLPEVTIAYHRDRKGDPLDIAQDDNDAAVYCRASEGWEEYCYLYRQGVWFFTPVGGGAGPFMVDADDPEGKKPANWRNLEGCLTFGQADHSPRYAIGARMDVQPLAPGVLLATPKP